MRTKEQILKDSFSQTGKVPTFDATASLHERLTIEVLLDIRDQLKTLTTVLGTVEKVTYRAG